MIAYDYMIAQSFQENKNGFLESKSSHELGTWDLMVDCPVDIVKSSQLILPGWTVAIVKVSLRESESKSESESKIERPICA